MALLDEGSTVTLLLDDVADRIGATGPSRNLLIEGISGHQIKTKESRSIKLRIKGLFSRNYEDLQAHTINQLSLRPQSVTKEDIKDYTHLKEIEDQLIYDGSPPTLLIGQDNWHLIVTRDLKAGNPSEPVASLTSLGWILHGCKSETTRPVLFINHVYEKKADSIDELIRDHFSLDSLGIKPKRPTNDPELRALEILEKTTHRLPEGRFECGLLWRTDNEIMPFNRDSAIRRLKGLERRLNKNKDYRSKYNEQVSNLLKSGYAEPANCRPTSPRTWYLPHFAVIHPQKGKIRMVFDAAERTNGKSLNDALLSGPDLLQSLFGVLIRFRQGPIAVAADIKEMFLRIKIREEDRDSLRFLWKENETDDEPREYRMKSLIFGATSSPCSAMYVNNRTAEDFQERYPVTADAILRCHYMDDYLQSLATTKETLKINKETDLIYKGFELRGWTSNDPAAIKGLENNPPKSTPLGDHNKHDNTLEMLWDTSIDALRLTLNLRNTPEGVLWHLRLPTKREVESTVVSVCGPLDIATPVPLQGKKLSRQLWRKGIGWDPIPKQAIEHRRQWSNILDRLETLNTPRCTNTQNKGEFCTSIEASESVYAATTCWRTADKGQLTIQLLAAKATVAPQEPTSIPRLKLQAALLGCRLTSNVQNKLDNIVGRRYYWADFRTVLAWIKTHLRTFKTCFTHWLTEKEEPSKPPEGRYVPKKFDRTDDVIRSRLRNFDINHRWLHGLESRACETARLFRRSL